MGNLFNSIPEIISQQTSESESEEYEREYESPEPIKKRYLISKNIDGEKMKVQ